MTALAVLSLGPVEGPFLAAEASAGTAKLSGAAFRLLNKPHEVCTLGSSYFIL